MQAQRPQRKPGINIACLLSVQNNFPRQLPDRIMKIGTLLTTAIVSLSTVGGGLAVYVAVTKYQTMDTDHRSPGAAGDRPRRQRHPALPQSRARLFHQHPLWPSRRRPGAACRAGQAAQADRCRPRQDERAAQGLPGPFDDGNTTGGNIDAINSKFTALREAIDKAMSGPPEARKDAAKKIVADNAVLNAGVTALLNEQVRRMAILNGDAYRQASYANIAMTLRDVGGLNSSLHKNLVGGRSRRPTPRRPRSAACRAATIRS